TRPLVRYGRHGRHIFLERVRVLDRAFRTVLHPPSAKKEVDLGENMLKDGCGGGNCVSDCVFDTRRGKC
ncbi:hypothetical protein J6590_069214, partial [Homalodisca vitripennis]